MSKMLDNYLQSKVIISMIKARDNLENRPSNQGIRYEVISMIKARDNLVTK